MKPEITLALVCLCCLGTSDFLYRWGQRYDLRPAPFMFLQNIAYITTAFCLGVFQNELLWSTGLMYGFLNGWLAFAAFLFVLLALSRGEVTTLVPLIRLNFAVTGVLTVVFLGEQLTGTRLIALLACATAIFSIGWSSSGTGTDHRAVLYALLAMLSFGLIGLFYKLGLAANATPTAMVLAQSIGVFSLAAPFALIRRRDFHPGVGRIGVPLACGVLTAASYAALATAFTYGDAIVVAPIAQLGFVMAIVLSMVFLDETLTRHKVTGILLAFAGITLFALG